MAQFSQEQFQELLQTLANMAAPAPREEQYPRPEKYKGDRSQTADLDRFVSQVRAYTVARGLYDETKKVLFAVGLLTEKAAEWAIPITDYMSAHDGALPADYDTLEKFFTQLRQNFGVTAIREVALIQLQKLCAIDHPQRNSRDVSAYMTEFQTMAGRASVSQDMMKFWFEQGLPNQYRQAYATMEVPPATFAASIKRAQQIYSSLAQNKLSAQAAVAPAPRVQNRAPQARVSHPTSNNDHVPMDVDASKAPTGNDPRKCYNCGEVGHISRNCKKPRKPRTVQATSTARIEEVKEEAEVDPKERVKDLEGKLADLMKVCASLEKQNQGLLGELAVIKKRVEEGDF